MESKSLSRRDFMKGCAATSTAAILGSGLAPRKIFAENNGKRPNIVLYVSDDHGLDALGIMNAVERKDVLEIVARNWRNDGPGARGKH